VNILLRCLSIDETKRFYQQILGFHVEDTANHTCTARRDGGAIIFTEADLWRSEPRCTGTLYFFIDDIELFYTEISGRLECEWPLQEMSCGLREFAVKDINGYTVAFAQRV